LTSAPYYAEGGVGAEPLGYTTDAEIAPHGKPTPETLLAFYRSRLRRWHCRNAGGLGPPILACLRGDAYVNVNLANLVETPATYHLIVDAHHKESE
jgi:hypothetical protein